MMKNVICGMCQGGCHVQAEIEEGKLISVKADTQSPSGRLCARGYFAPQALYGDQKLKKPLIRTGARGEGKFRTADWEEALDYAAKLMGDVKNAYGAKAMAAYYGRGILGTPVGALGRGIPGIKPFLANFGSPNDMNCGSICNIASSTVTPVSTMGITTREMGQDVEHSDYIISWGKNSASDDGPQSMLKRIKAAKERGAKLIVIDPRQSGLGEIADWWIPVLPGSDGALALAMLKLIIESERYDHAFVQEYTKGFEEFAEYVKSLNLAELSGYCGISVPEIEKLTDLFTSTSRISLISYTGLEYQLSGIQNNRAIFILWGITGKLDVEGGIHLNVKHRKTTKLFPLPTENVPIGADNGSILYGYTGSGQFAAVPKAVLEDDPYPVRGLLIAGGSPILSFPDQSTWEKTYRKLDCLIVMDRFFTEDCRYADVVFPCCSLYESPRLCMTKEGKAVAPAVLAPIEDARNDVVVLGGLAKRLGFGELYPQTEEELVSWLDANKKYLPAQLGFPGGGKNGGEFKKYESGLLREDGQPGFPTPSGKFEICSTYLEEYGFSPYPKYDDIRSLEGFGKEEYPFYLSTGARDNNRMGVYGMNIPEIAKLEPYPYMEINAQDAGELGLTDGDRAKVSTRFGENTFVVKIAGTAKHTIHIPHGGGSSFMSEGWKCGNVNVLHDLNLKDPITGFVLIKTLPCKVKKS